MATSARSSRVLLGLGFLAVGVLFLLENLTDWEIPWQGWWPAILIVIGLWNIVRNQAWFGGLVLTVLGVFFLLDTQDVWDYTIGDIWRFWPVVLILIGAKMLIKRGRKPARSKDHHHLEDKSVPGEVNLTSAFGSNRHRVTDQSLNGGEITSVFGSTEIDLRDASLAGGEATLEVNSVFGRTEIRVPDNWVVDMKATNVLGSTQDNRRTTPTESATDRLIITGACVFGSIEVES